MIFSWIFFLSLQSLAPLVPLNQRVQTAPNYSEDTLGPERYRVMRKKGTERAFSGAYLYESAPGIYSCAACRLPLFASEDKYDSGSGWPSFQKPLDSKNLYYQEDQSLPVQRYEVLCRGCDSHLGHVFRDGPPPKKLRYCINSITLILEKKI